MNSGWKVDDDNVLVDVGNRIKTFLQIPEKQRVWLSCLGDRFFLGISATPLKHALPAPDIQHSMAVLPMTQVAQRTRIKTKVNMDSEMERLKAQRESLTKPSRS